MRTPNTAPITVAWTEEGFAFLTRGEHPLICPHRTPGITPPTLAGEMPKQAPHLCSSDCALFRVLVIGPKSLKPYVQQGCSIEWNSIPFNPEPFKPANEPTGPIIKKL